MKQEWFSEWFDSPYYHLLYKNRDENEAKLFIQNLVANLEISEGSKVLDLACGKGRHSITLNELGFDVVGADLSVNSIEFAKQFENKKLRFIEHDMRNVIPNAQFDAVFNFFTSFGYFETLEENEKVIASVKQMLKDQGIFVIDFMNSKKVLDHLVKEETKVIQGIQFEIKKRFGNGQIFKEISFKDKGQAYCFIEKVQAIRLEDFEVMLNKFDFKIIRTFGDFSLQPFDLKNSNRLIIVAQKN